MAGIITYCILAGIIYGVTIGMMKFYYVRDFPSLTPDVFDYFLAVAAAIIPLSWPAVLLFAGWLVFHHGVFPFAWWINVSHSSR